MRAWQRFGYGREESSPRSSTALCDGFAGALDGPAADRLRGAVGMKRAAIVDRAASWPSRGAVRRVDRAGTPWEDTRVPMPPKGEALTNPFYAVAAICRRRSARAPL